jgi:cytochrome b6-f complex iron-sulfur subunit
MPEEKNEIETGRRSFLNFCIGSTALVAAAGIVYPLVRFLWPPPERIALFRRQLIRIPLGDVLVGRAVQVRYRSSPVVVIRPGPKKVVVLSAICTHLNCLVQWDEDTRRLICPCHEAIFDINGTPLRGPASKPLAPVPARIIGEEIVIGEV